MLQARPSGRNLAKLRASLDGLVSVFIVLTGFASGLGGRGWLFDVGFDHQVGEMLDGETDAAAHEKEGTAHDPEPALARALEIQPALAAAGHQQNLALHFLQILVLKLDSEVQQTALGAAVADDKIQGLAGQDGRLKDGKIRPGVGVKEGFKRRVDFDAGPADGDVLESSPIGLLPEAHLDRRFRRHAGGDPALPALEQGAHGGQKDENIEGRPGHRDRGGKAVGRVGENAEKPEPQRRGVQQEQHIKGLGQRTDKILRLGLALGRDLEGRSPRIEENSPNGRKGVDGLHELVQFGNERPTHVPEEEVRNQKHRQKMRDRIGGEIHEIGIVDFQSKKQEAQRSEPA